MTTISVPDRAITTTLRLLGAADFIAQARTPADARIARQRIWVARFDVAAAVLDQLADEGVAGDFVDEDPPPADASDDARASWLLDRCRVFAWYRTPDPDDDNSEVDCWDGSAADHAEFLYTLLGGVGLRPSPPAPTPPLDMSTATFRLEHVGTVHGRGSRATWHVHVLTPTCPQPDDMAAVAAAARDQFPVKAWPGPNVESQHRMSGPTRADSVHGTTADGAAWLTTFRVVLFTDSTD